MVYQVLAGRRQGEGGEGLLSRGALTMARSMIHFRRERRNQDATNLAALRKWPVPRKLTPTPGGTGRLGKDKAGLPPGARSPEHGSS